jgi:hypothetical protein
VSLAVKHVVALELNSDVLDAEKTHSVVDVLQDVLMLVWFPDDAMRAHCNHCRRHRPNVQIVH